MISRRNIRVKVMQSLYSVEAAGTETDVQKAQAMLTASFEQSRKLFTYLVYCITEIGRYAETDALKRSNKYLPTAADLTVNTKIAGNTLLWQIYEDPGFQATIEVFGLAGIIDPELIRKLYDKLTETEIYQTYATLPGREKKQEKEMLAYIFTHLMLPDDDFTEHMEAHFIHWDDDAEMMQLMVLNFLNKPASYNFLDIVSLEKRHFGRDLLATVIEKKEYCLSLIRPKLNNWEAERIAHLDLIMIRMGVCELLYFETIPTKVTINEYIDLAKDYSTPQSGQFINGILDNIHKELAEKGSLKKTEFKKSE